MKQKFLMSQKFSVSSDVWPNVNVNRQILIRSDPLPNKKTSINIKPINLDGLVLFQMLILNTYITN